MVSNIYKIRKIADRLCLKWRGRWSLGPNVTDDSLIGDSTSAGGSDGDGTESRVVTGVDIVINHYLQETSFTYKKYSKKKKKKKKYSKSCMKPIKGKLEEQKPENKAFHV
ncbi:translationally-controlled tumor protein-like [Tenrec ecaudatus]|uniref:translationally-controlled tumor protein-like n=1 Tax=Tenrec ecaudatus TaxID=94439 RepID=UPI003F59466B